MTGLKSFVAMAMAGSLLSGCVAMTPPVDVTRFHNAQVAAIVPGSVVIEANLTDEGHSRSIEYATYSAAILHELQRVGFTEAREAAKDSKYLVRYTIERAVLSAGGTRSPISVGVGGSTGSYGSGVGLGIGINLGGKPKDKIVTELSVRITKRDDGTVVWEGRASVEAKQGSPASQPGLAAAKLAAALFKDFPGESGTTIRVK
ncbi:DUF4136 domain-containing protein [Sphingorhabdus sp. M41]|uniref:DUF4136 domain-containing protein n=1 Tax=Sphingorhabdus sp. M41 TaxID=1806885 RepID=UPI00078E7A7A|nr:DUF4136 domain-containing protein [Sphingorhabdus sp. M41]AMO70622.1 hypothetical protein AZE99_01045 [Sphingorhabdus sp. M41]